MFRTDISLTTIVAIGGILFTGTQKWTETQVKIEAMKVRVERIESTRFTDRDGEWLQRGLTRELAAIRTALKNIDKRIGRFEDREFSGAPRN